MQNVKPQDQNIRFLITANYQRMMSFEHAAFLTNEPSFKKFYFEKAEESEINIRQLSIMLHLGFDAASGVITLENAKADQFVSNMFHGKKSTFKILESVKTIEKRIASWYQTILKEGKDLPAEILGIIEAQYKSMNNAQLQMDCL